MSGPDERVRRYIFVALGLRQLLISLEYIRLALAAGKVRRAFLDTYRTACLAPSPEIREVFEEMRRGNAALFAEYW